MICLFMEYPHYRNAAISVMIHVPGKRDVNNACLVEAIQEMIEWFRLALLKNNCATSEVWSFPPTKIVNDDNEAFGIKAFVFGKINRSNISIVMEIVKNAFFPKKKVKSLYIEIPRIVWKKIDRNAFITEIISVCTHIYASYACIDTLALLTHPDIYTCGYRLFCPEAKDIDPESKLPGVFWWQYFSEDMIGRNYHPIDSISDIFEKHRFDQDRYMYEVQLSNSIDKLSITTRMVFRNIYSHALYSYFNRENMFVSIFKYNYFILFSINQAGTK